MTEGTQLLKERAQTWIIHQEHKDKVCHNCSKCLITPNTNPHNHQSTHLPQCTTCHYAYYCTAQCQQQHKTIHSIECNVLRQIDELSDRVLVNVDLLRAALAYIVQRGQDAKDDNNSTVSTSPANFLASQSHLNTMIGHSTQLSTADTNNMLSAATSLMSLLPTEYHC